MKSGSQFPAQPIEMFVQQRQDERPERQMDELSHPLLKFRRIDGSNLLTATPKNKREEIQNQRRTRRLLDATESEKSPAGKRRK
jgi:hypothetical protein